MLMTPCETEKLVHLKREKVSTFAKLNCLQYSTD